MEPPQTFSNHIIAEIARCVEFFHMSLGWFDSTEPSLTTSLQGNQCGCLCTSSGWFKHIEPFRTFSNQMRIIPVDCHTYAPVQREGMYSGCKSAINYDVSAMRLHTSGINEKVYCAQEPTIVSKSYVLFMLIGAIRGIREK